MTSIDSHGVVDHESNLDTTQGSTNKGGLACFDDTCICRGVVDKQEGDQMGVRSGWIDHGEGVESRHIVDYKVGVFEGVDE